MTWQRLLTPDNLRDVMTQAYREAQRVIEAGALIVSLSKPNRSLEQNAKFHAMINDIRDQCFKGYEFSHFKAALINQFEHAMRENGEELSRPSATAWDWVNQECVTVRPSTTQFTKAEASAFIEFLYATGAEYGVSWSPIVIKIYNEVQNDKQKLQANSNPKTLA